MPGALSGRKITMMICRYVRPRRAPKKIPADEGSNPSVPIASLLGMLQSKKKKVWVIWTHSIMKKLKQLTLTPGWKFKKLTADDMADENEIAVLEKQTKTYYFYIQVLEYDTEFVITFKEFRFIQIEKYLNKRNTEEEAIKLVKELMSWSDKVPEFDII